MNTFHDREWGDGTESPAEFNPTELDCRQWIRELKNAGFKLAILTAKHHDGFCLWPSAYTEHSVKNSPYKNGKGDIVREFTDACREFGMKAGIYLSPWDRHEPTWGSEAYNDFYVGQLTELMSNYGDIYECWWDGAGSEKAHYDWERWGSVVRALQPNAVIFGSLGAAPYVDVRWVGNEKGIAGDPCWATVDMSSLERETPSELNSGDPNGSHFIPAEADVSLRPGWFWHEDQDGEIRSPENLARLWFASVGRNGGLLLNVPPDNRGLIKDGDIASLKGFRRILDEGFEKNIAADGKMRASSQRSPLCPPEAVTGGDRESFYSPADGDPCPTLELTFPQSVEFNCFVLSEVIELGQKIRGFELWISRGGEWSKLLEGQCVGNKYARYFDRVSCEGVRLKITQAVSAPLIRHLGLYSIADLTAPDVINGFKRRDLAKSSSAKIERNREENEIYLQLGGIRLFNLLKVKGEGIKACSVYVFNGSSFEYVGDAREGESPNEWIFPFEKMVDWSYRIKVKLLPEPDNTTVPLDDCSLSLYCSEG